MSTIPEDPGAVEAEYVAVSAQALRTSGGPAALDALGWWDMLSDLDDRDQRTAALALFRAQGRELATSPALGGLLAQPYLAGTGLAPGAAVATVTRTSARRGPVHLLVGDPGDRALLVDRPDHGPSLVERDAVELRPVDVPGRLALHEVDVEWARATPLDGPGDVDGARRRSTFLGRLALALEILGAAEATVDLAVAYAGDREQFGQPIGTFQAVRHLLAWARTDGVAVAAVLRQAVALDRAAPARADEVAKALAGRALQVFGGIGFTAEHDHHHHHGRVLALDALLGTSAELTHGLGAWLRRVGDPGFAAATLLPADPSADAAGVPDPGPEGLVQLATT